jgi:hypothetical protein
MGDLGGDGSMGRYCGSSSVALGPLLRGRRCRRRAGARRGGTQWGGALRGAALPTPVRSPRIECRMEARIAFVSGLAILPSFCLLFSPLFLLFSLYSKVRVLITCLNTNFVD